jgi:hypothetical protein
MIPEIARVELVRGSRPHQHGPTAGGGTRDVLVAQGLQANLQIDLVARFHDVARLSKESNSLSSITRRIHDFE